MSAKFDLVVFDWDGTLVDSTGLITRSIQFAAADLQLPVPSDEQASHVIGLGLHDALASAVPSLAPDQIAEFAARYRHHYLQHESEIQVFDGVREMLQELQQRTKMAVATGKNSPGLERGLDATGLRTHFCATRCADQTHSKPHPAMLLELAAEVGVDPQRMLMIGDTSHDLLMAHAAGAAAVGVCYGAHQRPHLELHAALALVDSVAQLRSWLSRNV